MMGKIYDRSTRTITNLWMPQSKIILSSIDVEITLGLSHKITASLEMPYREGLAIVEGTLFSISNILSVRFGYSQTGWMSPWMAGIMTNPSCSLSDTWTIGIEAQGGGALALARTATKEWSGTRYYIIEEIASRLGLLVEADCINQKMTEPVTLNQTGETYFLYLAAIIHDAGYDFFISSNLDGKATLFIKDRMSAPRPARSFVKYGPIDRDKNQYPILEFDSEPTPFKSSGDAAIKSVWMDDEGNIVKYTATESASALPRTGTGSVAGGKEDIRHDESGLYMDQQVLSYESGELMFLPSQWSTASEASVQAKYDEGLAIPPWKTSITTIGIPNMLPGELVAIYGCSKRYDGNYGVFSVKHSISDGGFSTSFECTRNAFSGLQGYGDDNYPVETPPVGA